MSPKPDMSAERIPQILNAAVAVFAAKGLSQATMSDIAEAAGLSKGTLYLYFKDKDALIFSVLMASLQQGFGALEAILASDGSVRDQILQWVGTHTRQMAESAGFLSIGFEFFALASRDGEIRERLRDYFHRYRELLTQVIEKGMERGEFRRVDAEPIAVAIIALFEGFNVLWMTDSQHDGLLALRMQAIQLILDGIATMD